MKASTPLVHKLLTIFSFLAVLGTGAAVRADGTTPGDKCSGPIANNAAAAGVCGPVCDKLGLRFAGNWSCDHAPVSGARCAGGQCVCGCAAKPGDKCSGPIGNNAAAAGVCGPVCSKLGLHFAGNWSCDHAPVSGAKCAGGQCVCGCKQ